MPTLVTQVPSDHALARGYGYDLGQCKSWRAPKTRHLAPQLYGESGRLFVMKLAMLGPSRVVSHCEKRAPGCSLTGSSETLSGQQKPVDRRPIARRVVWSCLDGSACCRPGSDHDRSCLLPRLVFLLFCAEDQQGRRSSHSDHDAEARGSATVHLERTDQFLLCRAV